MPTYHALGVTASLTVAELRPTLTTLLETRQGAAHQADARRIDAAFSAGQRLPESPVSVCPDGNRVMDFIGRNRNLPLLMVEVGDEIQPHWVHNLCRDHDEDNLQRKFPIVATQHITEDSGDDPRTSQPDPCGTKTIQNGSQMRSLRSKGRGDAEFEILDGNSQASVQSEKGFERVHLQSKYTPKALRLTVEWNENTFLPAPRGPRAAKDLKIELFVNGVFASVKFVTSRASSSNVSEKSTYLSGIRIHRQIEKPFIYRSVGDDEAESLITLRRWNDISAALRREAAGRGRNRFDEAPPSAEFLSALSQLDLPNALRDHKTIGVMDIIITAGSGGKYGPDTNYLTAPTRMDCKGYAVPAGGTLELDDYTNTSLTPHVCRSQLFGSLPTQGQKATAGEEPQTATREDMTSTRADSVIESITLENSKSRHGSPTHDTSKKKSQIYPYGQRQTSVPPPVSHAAMEPVATHSTASRAREAISPQNERHDLALTSVDIANEATLPMDGHLLERIACPMPTTSFSTPSQTNTNRQQSTTADFENVQNSRKRKAVSTLPQRRSRRRKGNVPTTDTVEVVRSGHNKSRDHTASSSTPFSIRKSGATAPGGARFCTPEEALRTFQPPPTCLGSVVTLAGGDVFRQIGKERKGIFNEESVVIGMRFFVV